MSFVKLDCGILDSTIWIDRPARELFITALLMAVPKELIESCPQIRVRTLEATGFTVPPGWYGFVSAAGAGIVRRSGMELEAGLDALERLGAPELDSRTPDFEGRRMVRVAGGYVILNYAKYREKDHTTAERSRRYRERKLKGDGKVKKRMEQVRRESAGREARYVKAEGDVEMEDRIAAEDLPGGLK